MPSIFSDHFNSDGSSPGVVPSLAAELALDSQRRPSGGIAYAEVLFKRMRVNTGTAAGIGDRIVLGSFKSSERIYRLFVASDGGATAGAADIGLYKAGSAHDGVVIDANLFATALDISTAILYVDEFKQATTLTDQDRGKTLWELADLGDGTYASDPMELWDLVATVTTAFTVAVTDILVVAEFTAQP